MGSIATARWRQRRARSLLAAHVESFACLLGYSNQIDHRFLDRRRVVPLLRDLAGATPVVRPGQRGYDDQYRWLSERIDPASSFEQEFLAELYRRRLALPDRAQHSPADGISAQPDFYYDRDPAPGVCIFVDGPSHATSRRSRHDHTQRDALRARGFQIVVIQPEPTIADQLARRPDLFQPSDIAQ